jgi:hypothetical protein
MGVGIGDGSKPCCMKEEKGGNGASRSEIAGDISAYEDGVYLGTTAEGIRQSETASSRR